MSEAQTPAQPETPVLEVTDLDQFVTHLVGWHSNKVKTLGHLLNLPEETLDIQVGDAPPITLADNILVGFKLGIEMALMELGSLPFVYETEPEETTLCASVQTDNANAATLA